MEWSVLRNRTGKKYGFRRFRAHVTSKLDHEKVVRLEWIESIRSLRGVVNKFPVEPPILVRSELDDLALEIHLPMKTGSIQVEIKGKPSVMFCRDVWNRWIQFVDEYICVQIDR